MNVEIFDRMAAAFPDACFTVPPDLALVLGSGWGDVLRADRTLVQVSYADIPEMGAATVPGHRGEFRLYERHGHRIAAFCGRRHWYEGTGWEQVVMPVEMARRMGCANILLTNAAGGINNALRPGDFVILRDHINAAGANPLRGPHNPDWGPRFPDMTQVYAQHLRDTLTAAGRRLGLRILEGVYTFVQGPIFETPAEIDRYARMGGDVVGMSTVPEATFARACGLRTAGLSLVTNLAAGRSQAPLSHAEVIELSEKAKAPMSELIDAFIATF